MHDRDYPTGRTANTIWPGARVLRLFESNGFGYRAIHQRRGDDDGPAA